MSGQENFVARWSRLKRKATKRSDEQAHAAAPSASEPEEKGRSGRPDGAPAAPAAAAASSEGAFDVANLPSIDSITAGTDIRGFLQSGVPAELTRAALRRAWTTDPAIRDFIGLAENQWDFTDPAAIPGFGHLHAADSVGGPVAQALEKWEGPAAGETDASSSAGADDAPAARREHVSPHTRSSSQVPSESTGIAGGEPRNELVEGQDKAGSVALQHDPASADPAPVRNRRSHGRALPK